MKKIEAIAKTMRLLLFFDREQIVFPAAENILIVGKFGGIIKLDDEIVQYFGYAIVDRSKNASVWQTPQAHWQLPRSARRDVCQRWK